MARRKRTSGTQLELLDIPEQPLSYPSGFFPPRECFKRICFAVSFLQISTNACSAVCTADEANNDTGACEWNIDANVDHEWRLYSMASDSGTKSSSFCERMANVHVLGHEVPSSAGPILGGVGRTIATRWSVGDSADGKSRKG